MNEDPCGFGYETLKRLHTVACAGFYVWGRDDWYPNGAESDSDL